MEQLEEAFTWTVGVVVATVVAVVVVFVIATEMNSRDCLAAGYPSTRIDYTLTAYCVKRVNQTDVVKRVEEARY